MSAYYKTLILWFFPLIITAQSDYQYNWKYYTTGNTGILGDYAEGLFIGQNGDPYIAAYTPGWEEGGFSKFMVQENRWINYSNMEYPAIGSTYDVGASRISDIVESADGKLWMAGWRGILSFDPSIGGSSIQFWGSGNSLHPGGRTMDIDIAPDGSVWAAVQSVTWGGGGLVKYDPLTDQWQYWGYGSTANNWPSLIGYTERVSIRSKANTAYEVWIDGEGWNTMIIFDSETQLFTLQPQEYQAGEIVALPGRDCTDDDGNMWALRYTLPGEAFSLDYYTPDGNWVTPTQASSEILSDIWAFKAYGNHQALITGLNSEIWDLSGDSWISKGIWREGAYTYAMDADTEGNIWVTGVGGAARRDANSGNWQRYRITNSSQIDYWVQDMDIDESGNVWMTGNAGPGVGGFQQFDGVNWIGYNEHTYGLGYSFPFPTDNTMEILRRSYNGDVIINPMYEGLHAWNGNQYTALTGSFSISKGLVEDSYGRLWNLGEYYALQYLDEYGWTSVDLIGSGTNIMKDPVRQGTIWACTGHQILRTDGDYSYSKSPEDFPELDPQSDMFSTVVPGADGIAWLGSNKGLFRIDANTNTYIFFSSENSALKGESITPIAYTADGRIWYSSFGSLNEEDTGLGWFDGTDFGFFPVVDGGLPHSQIIDAEVKLTETGYELWMSCLSRGIAILNVINNPVGTGPEASKTEIFSVQNYPNPFSEATNFEITIPFPERLNIRIYNMTGDLVKILIDKQLAAGKHQIRWNSGSTVRKGVYIAIIQSASVSKTFRLVVQ